MEFEIDKDEIKPSPYPAPKKRGPKMKYDEKKMDSMAIDLEAWVNNNVISKKQFLMTDWCMEQGFSRMMYLKTKGRSEKFDEAWAYAKEWQEHMLVKGALFSKLNVKMVIFFLACHHGWRHDTNTDPRETNLSNDLANFRVFMEKKEELNKNTKKGDMDAKD
jgi:hypothetical protein